MDTLVSMRRARLLGPAKSNQESLRRLDEVQSKIRRLIQAPLVRGPQDLAIDGSKMMAITGLSPGPEVGRILKHLSEELMEHPEWNTRKKLAAMVQQMQLTALPEHSEALVEIHGTAGRLKTGVKPKA